MHAFAAILFVLVGHAAATSPIPICCPNGAGKNICSDGKGNRFDATCCANGEWKCQQKGVYTDVCVLSGLGDGAECAPPVFPPVKPNVKCCKPTSKPKMCPGAGYGSKKVPALCCANGKYRCGSCDDFGGESKKCKCCNPAKIATQVDCGIGRPVCCNDGRWRCGSSASKVCKPFLGNGKKCTRPAPPPPTPALKPSVCCNPDIKLACVPAAGSYGAAATHPNCCKDGSWSCAGCSNGNGLVCPPPPPPASSPCCNPGAKIACTASSYGTVLPPKCCKDGAWSCTGCSANGGNGNECSTGSGYTS